MKRFLGRLLQSDMLLRFALFSSLAVYLQTINFDYVYDDFQFIVLNPWLDSWRGLPKIFLHQSWGFSESAVPARFYRPVFLLWLWMVRHLTAPLPGWYHLALVLTHLCAVYMAYRLAKALLVDELSSAICVVLFAAHPSKVEAVSWISAGAEPLMAVFFFASILAYLRWRQPGRNRLVWLGASFLCAVAATLTKETAVVLPAILFAHAWCFEGGGSNSGHEIGHRLHRLWQAGLAALPCAVADVLWAGTRLRLMHGLGNGSLPASIRTTLFTVPIAYWLYIRQLLWPVTLSEFYPVTVVHRFSMLRVALPLAALLTLALLYILWARRSPVRQFAGIWFLLTLAPVIYGFQVVQLHDRYLYLPSFAAALMAAGALQQMRWPTAERLGAVQVAGVLGLALVLSVISIRECYVWRTGLSVFTRAVQLAPINEEAILQLASVEFGEGKRQQAIATLEQAVRQQPQSGRLLFTLGDRLYQEGETARARPLLERTQQMPVEADFRSTALYDLAMIDLQQGQAEAAKTRLREAVRLAPKVAGYRRLLADLERNPPR